MLAGFPSIEPSGSVRHTTCGTSVAQRVRSTISRIWNHGRLAYGRSATGVRGCWQGRRRRSASSNHHIDTDVHLSREEGRAGQRHQAAVKIRKPTRSSRPCRTVLRASTSARDAAWQTMAVIRSTGAQQPVERRRGRRLLRAARPPSSVPGTPASQAAMPATATNPSRSASNAPAPTPIAMARPESRPSSFQRIPARSVSPISHRLDSIPR